MTNEELIQKAIEMIHPMRIDRTSMGGVSCALLTTNDSVFMGVCIDTICGMGFCAEHSAISQMITNGEYLIKKIVAVKRGEDGNFYVLAPCGRCREFIYQTNNLNLDTDVVLSVDKSLKLEEILPFYDFCQKID